MAFSRKLPSFFFLVLLSVGLTVFIRPGNGRAQDTDADGILDATEVRIGSNPQHKDIFVECDYMRIDFNNDGDSTDLGEHTHRLDDKVVQQLIQVFAAAPVTNPGGACQGGPRNTLACTSKSDCANFPCSFTGITLHLEQNQALPDQRFLDFTNRKGGLNFFDIKNTHFDFANRAPYYHYCILAHDASEEMGSASGQGEIFGNDFMVTLGSWPSEAGKPTGSMKDQVGTLLHELGHNLGLEHGGGNSLNHKPNYLSVMNYSFQVTGIRRTGVLSPRFDLSRTLLPPLNENLLNETVGIQDGSDITRFFCQQSTLMKTGLGSGAIDWNCSSSPNASVATNINADRTFLADPARDVLVGYNDWNSLRLNFTTSPLYDAGAGVGFIQHQRYLGAYKPSGITGTRGVDREPEVTFPEGRCLEFLSIIREGGGTSPLLFRNAYTHPKDGGEGIPPNGIGDICD